MLPPIEYLPDTAVDPALDAQLRALLSTCFTGPHNERFKTQRYYNEMPAHRWFIREPGRIIAHLATHDKTLGTTIGDLPIAGIAEVSVHPGFRGRGLVRQLLAAAHAYHTARAVPFAFLFGSRDVYSSSGYLPVTNPLRCFHPDSAKWIVQPLDSAMVKPLGTTIWPPGEIDLRGPMF